MQFLLRSSFAYHSSAELKSLIQKTNGIILATKRILNDMKQRFDKTVSSSVLQREEIKIRENLTRDVFSSFIGITVEYQNAQKKYLLDVENAIKLEVLNSRPDASEDHIAAALSALTKVTPAVTSAPAAAAPSAGESSMQTLAITLTSDRHAHSASPSIEALVQGAATNHSALKVLNDSITELHQLLFHYTLFMLKRDSCMTSVSSGLGSAAGDEDHLILTQRKICCTRRVVFCSCFVAMSLLVADVVAAVGM